MKRKKVIIVLLCVCLILVPAFYNGLTVKKYTLKTDDLVNNQGIRIVLISDLHSHIYGKEQKKLINKIKKQNPDIIVMAGDIADDEVSILGTQLLLKGIKDFAPVYYVTGNHEFLSGDVANIKQLFIDNGVTVLEQEISSVEVKGNKINICGIDDLHVFDYENNEFLDKCTSKYDLLLPFSHLNKDEYNILIAHRPEWIEQYKKYNFDLVLSGHAHGGQVRIPFILNGLFAPNQGFFPKYAGGLYKHHDLIHIVSRGISFNPRLPRIFNPPEIVVVDIGSKGK